MHSLTVAPRPIRDVAREALASIEASIGRLEAWGARVSTESRLNQAAAVLKHGAESGVLVPRHRNDRLGLRALELSFDYRDIASTLPSRRIASIRHEIEQSLQGELEPREGALKPWQLQSQFMVRAALVRAGLQPVHPSKSSQQASKTPDLVIKNGLSSYAVEAKRPEYSRNVVPRMKNGSEQLAEYGLHGAVVVDVADCIRDLSVDDAGKEVFRLARAMSSEIFEEGHGHHPGYSNIMVTGTYARLVWTSTDGESDAMVNVHSSSSMTVYASTRNSLLGHRARWLRERLLAGLNMLGVSGQ